MKNKVIFSILSLVILTIGYLWWSSPIHFLNNIKVDDIMRIEVFNGSNGMDFVIEDYDDINNIVSNIQNISLKKVKISLGYMGSLYNLKFINTESKVVDEFIVNNNDTIRRDPFFYRDSTSRLCIDLIRSLENSIKVDN